MLQALLPILLGLAAGGGVMAGTSAIQGRQQRKNMQAKEGLFQQRMANPFPGMQAPFQLQGQAGQGVPGAAGQPGERTVQTTKTTPTTKTTETTKTGPPPEQPEQPDPSSPEVMMQSAILGRPVMMPGMPMTPPIMKYTPPAATFKSLSIKDPLTGGTYNVQPNEGGFYQASLSEHKAHYAPQVATGQMTQQQADLKARIETEYATAAWSGNKPNIEQIRMLTEDMHDVSNQFINALTYIDEWIDMDIPWSEIPGMLRQKEIYVEPEVLDRVREFLLGKYQSWGAQNIHDPAQLDAYMRSQDNRFGIPTRKPVARVEDLGPEMVSEMAQRGTAKETPISSLGGGYGGELEKGREMARYHQRPRIEQTQAMNLSGPRTLIASGIAPIQEILERRKGADLTGPFDPLKKKFDKYGVPGLSDQDRVAMRGYLDSLMDILYKMRGKQLAVAEIQKAENLMPDMKMDEEAIATQLDVFTNYVLHTSLGNLSSLHRAGVDIGGASIAEVMEYESLREELGDKLLFDYKGPYVKDEKTGEKLRPVPVE